ncbi:MAG TPA: NAD(P)H-hydrate dehydratase [Methylophaga aminisulfidivorans]|uniref:Bifunctional NAD(P)H-hydrate repair enzyme n=1 Tax=Methylophaga aminisulfidivorans TaxID=230105 RepID=A0A7C1ZFQ4_9GAMM|nr:NAD(P)H-hydrate dehydratase [Methylophaga aminisulfidivorans]
MQALPTALFSAQQTQEIDRLIINQYGIPGGTLMCRAASAALDCLQQIWPKAERILVICGAGNNGGDGYDLATQAFQKGLKVNVIELTPPSENKPDAFQARQSWLATGQQPMTFDGSLPAADVIVDSLFGTGLDREVSGDYLDVINAVNAQNAADVMSIDVPSGLSANTGKVLGHAIRADATISFLGLNLGLFTGQGPHYSGKVYFDDLNAPADVYTDIPSIAQRATFQAMAPLLSPRQKTAHKGHFGHLLIIGGNQGMSGAARIAAEAGARTGAGLISVATHPQHASWLNCERPELMVKAIHASDDLKAPAKLASVLCLGPGLGQDQWARSLFKETLFLPHPKVIDADALNLLSQHTQHAGNWILTPHPGEAARLLNCETTDIEADRFAAAKALQQQYGGIIVLKGAGTIITNGVETKIANYGNPGMASGGMGDALTGIIGALVAQQLSLFDAACLGVMVHGMAGDQAAIKGERGLLAMDLIAEIRDIINPSIDVRVPYALLSG